MHSEAHVTTGTPARYIKRLCKHFSHKVEASYTADTGEVDFPFGRCTMNADTSRLVIRAEAEGEEALRRVEDVVERHLKQFAAGQEELDVVWKDASRESEG